MPQHRCSLLIALLLLFVAGVGKALRPEGNIQGVSIGAEGSEGVAGLGQHHGPPLGSVFESVTAAISAGAVVGTMGVEGYPTRLPPSEAKVQEDPVFIEDDSYGRMMQVLVTGPTACSPCQRETLDIYVGASVYKLPITFSLRAGETFLAYVQVPPMTRQEETSKGWYETGPAVDGKLFFKSGDILTYSVQVPKDKGPGDSMSSWCPSWNSATKEGVTLIVPRGVRYPRTVTFECNPKARQAAREAKRQKVMIEMELLSDYRCCCEGHGEMQTNCLWFRKNLLKPGDHCPRVQMSPFSDKLCAADFCYPWAEGKCITTHHSYVQSCEITTREEGPHHFFKGGRCSQSGGSGGCCGGADSVDRPGQ
mmetsp:Transcript_104808/g.263981  ORF Transcript_104808/g.263981 Transcript_104808/m.263981 type:complete len:365 (+) Transcript_104808:40-1134(+)